MSVKEVSDKWGISTKWVQILYSKGRVVGTLKEGRNDKQYYEQF